jgi:hypothetical protein
MPQVLVVDIDKGAAEALAKEVSKHGINEQDVSVVLLGPGEPLNLLRFWPKVSIVVVGAIPQRISQRGMAAAVQRHLGATIIFPPEHKRKGYPGILRLGRAFYPLCPESWDAIITYQAGQLTSTGP